MPPIYTLAFTLPSPSLFSWLITTHLLGPTSGIISSRKSSLAVPHLYPIPVCVSCPLCVPFISSKNISIFHTFFFFIIIFSQACFKTRLWETSEEGLFIFGSLEPSRGHQQSTPPGLTTSCQLDSWGQPFPCWLLSLGCTTAHGRSPTQMDLFLVLFN